MRRNIPAEHSAVSSQSWANNSLVHIACLVFLILVIYANTLEVPFQWDEGSFLVKNPIVSDLHYFLTPAEARGFEHYDSFVGRYIGYLTFALNYRLHGLSIAGYHIVNIAIHIANSILVYFLVLLTFRTPFMRQGPGTRDQGSAGARDQGPGTRDQGSGNPLPVPHPWSPVPKMIAFFSAAVFAVHPLQTEAVTYVFQRFASLVAFFYLLSLAAYIKSRLSEGKGMRLLYYGISFISAVLAMKTKENSFTLPFVIMLYEFCFLSSPSTDLKSRISNLKFTVPFLLILAIIPLTLMSLSGSHQFDPVSYGARQFSRGEYLFTQFRVVVTYLRLLFFPVNQNIGYDYPIFKSFFDPQVMLSFVFLASLFGFGVCLVTRKQGPGTRDRGPGKRQGLGIRDQGPGSKDSRPLRLMGFGILWFFITLSVESSIIPIPMPINEYRVYLPSVGIIISVVTGIFLLKAKKQAEAKGKAKALSVPVFMFFVVGVLSVATHLRNDVWRDHLTLWEDTAKKSPNKAEVHYSLGSTYESLNMLDKAVDQYLIAIKLRPGFAEAHYSLGATYQDLNMSDKAVEQFLIAIELKPDFEEAHYNLGTIYQAHNLPDKAIEQYLTAIKLKPGDAEAHFNLAVTYQNRKMFDRAIDEYLTGLKLKPYSADAYFNLGLIYYGLGQNENARKAVTEGLQLRPDDQRAQQLLKDVL